MSRTKGHNFERHVAQLFVEAGFPDARRQTEYHIKDALGVDLQDTEPFAVQCKRGRGYAPINAIEEIQTLHYELDLEYHPPAQLVPVLLTKADSKPAMAVLPAEEFFKLIRDAYKQ